MGYGKAWKVPVSTLEDLIDNADLNNDCLIEVWNTNDNQISGCSLWLKLSSWVDLFPIEPPTDPTI